MGKRDKHYLLHAYVCGESCVRWSNDIGWVTFSQVYRDRPNNCRFAVAEEKPDQIIVWDLFDVMQTPSYRLITPEPFGLHTTIDAAVMATQMLYDTE
jgi:hypothetical protein